MREDRAGSLLTRARRRVERSARPIGAVMTAAVVAAGCAAGVASGPPASGPAPGTAAVGAGLTDITQPSPESPRRGGSLAVGLGAETDSLDPVKGQWAGQGYQLARAVYDPLVAVDKDGIPKPYLAERLDPNEDFTAWTITLRPGVQFHDGSPLDAQALVKNLRAQQQSIVTGQIFAPVRDVEAVGPLSVRVVMAKPWSTFPGYLAAQPGFVAAPATLDDPDGGRRPIGTGPFRFASWSNSRIVFTRNDSYWRKDLPLLDRVEFKVVPDNNTRLQALRSGDVDVAELTFPDQVFAVRDTAQDSGDLQFLIEPKAQTPSIVVGLNTAKAPFDDLDARRAVAAAVDTRSLSEDLFGRLYPPSDGPLSKSSPWYVPTDYPAYDVAAARELADRYKANHGGTPLSFSVNVPNDPSLLAVAQQCQEMWKAAGIDARIETPEQTKLLLDALTGNYQATGFIQFGSPTIEASYIFLHSSTAKRPGEGISINFTRFTNPDMDRALDDGRKTLDPDAQRVATELAQKTLGAQVPYVFLVRTVGALGAQPGVHGLRGATLPDGSPAMDLDGTNFWLGQVWVGT